MRIKINRAGIKATRPGDKAGHGDVSVTFRRDRARLIRHLSPPATPRPVARSRPAVAAGGLNKGLPRRLRTAKPLSITEPPPSTIEREPRDCCPVCEGDRLSSVDHAAAGDLWHLKRCQACGFLFLSDPPKLEALVEDFAWEKTIVRESERRDREFAPLIGKARRGVRTVRRRVRALTKRDKTAELSHRFFEPGPVLDIGCGDGGLIKSLPETAVPWGIELSAGLIRAARPLFEARGGKMIEADALTGLRQCPDDHFTGVLARSFLEHETRPCEVLCEIRRVLRPGGAVILKMPNYGCLNRKLRGDQWCGYRFPDHVNYFTPRHLEQLLDRAGLEIRRFAPRDRFPTSDNMWCVAAAP